MATSGLLSSNLMTSIFRHRKLLSYLFFGTMGLVIVVTLLLPKEYESRMTIVVQNVRAPQTLSADKKDGAADQTEESQDAMDAQVNSEIELLSSEDLLEHLVSYRGQLVPEQPAPAAGSKDMAQAIKALNKRLEIDPVRKSMVVDVSYLDKDPLVAQKMLTELTRTYLEKHVRLRRPAGAYSFFETEASDYDKRLSEAQDALAAFQKQNQFVSLGEEKASLSKNMEDAQTSVLTDQAALRSEDSQISSLLAKVASVSPRVPTLMQDSSNGFAQQPLVTALTDLQVRRALALSHYQPNDRAVLELDAQIAAAQQGLKEVNDNRQTVKSTDANPVWVALDQQLQSQEVTKAGIAAHLGAVVSQVGGYRARFDHLQDITTQNDELERKVQELSDDAQTFASKRDSARIEDQLDQDKFGNVALALAPTFSWQHVKPSLVVNTLLGFVSAIFLCIGALLVTESTRQTVLTQAELEAACERPVLATISEVDNIDRIFNLGGSAFRTGRLPFQSAESARS